jgi:hypothetical protein
MSRPAKLFSICLVFGIFLFSYSFDLFTVREVTPGRKAAWVKIRIFEEGAHHAEVSMGLPVGLVKTLLTSAHSSGTVEMDGEDLDLRAIWLRLRDTDAGKPLEFGDDGDRVQIWLE